MELVYGVFFIFVGSFQFHFLPFVFEISRLLPILSKPMLLVYLALIQHNPYPFSSTKLSFFSSSFLRFFFHFHFLFFSFQPFFLNSKKLLPGYDFGNALLPGTAGTRGTHFLNPWLRCHWTYPLISCQPPLNIQGLLLAVHHSQPQFKPSVP